MFVRVLIVAYSEPKFCIITTSTQQLEFIMPNWVTTDITITGSESEINKIITVSKLNPELFGEREDEQVFDFNGFVPMPEKLSNTQAPSEIPLLMLMLAEEDPSLVDDDLYIVMNIVKIYYGTAMGKHRNLHEFEIDRMRIFTQNLFPNAEKLSEVLPMLATHAEYQERKNTPKNQENFECLKEFGYADWYNWSIDNWGTKWNSHSIFALVTTQDDQTTLSLVMDTAWDVPVPILNHIKENYNVAIDGLAADEGGNFAAVIDNVKDEVEVKFYQYNEENLEKINSICLDVLGYKPFADEEDEEEDE